MPFIVAGFTWLAQFLATLLAGVFSWYTQYLAKRLAIIAAAVAAMMVLTGGFFLAIGALASALQAQSPPWFAQACSLVVPYNFQACMSAIVSAHVLRWVYVWKIRVLNMKSA